MYSTFRGKEEVSLILRGKFLHEDKTAEVVSVRIGGGLYYVLLKSEMQFEQRNNGLLAMVGS